MKILPICGRFDDKVCLFVLPNWLPYTVVLIEITFRLVIMFYPITDLCGYIHKDPTNLRPVPVIYKMLGLNNQITLTCMYDWKDETSIGIN